MLFKKTIQCIANDSFRRHASHVAFLGIGNMGIHMTRNLIEKGETLKVFDINRKNAEAVKGATVCDSPAAVAKDARVIVTMLPDGDVVDRAIFGPGGIAEGASPNTLLIDSSTISPIQARNIAKKATDKGFRFIDAPVSGGVTGAEAGTLAFMIGGKQEDFKEAEPLVLKMGKKAFYCGDWGAGQITKLCNNMILGITMLGTAEALNLGEKMGLDPKLLTSIVNVSTGRSWSSDTYNPVPGIMPNVPASKGYEGGFLVKLISKDLNLAQEMAKSCDAAIPMGGLAQQMYRVLKTSGLGDKDFGIIYKFLQGKGN